MVVFLYLIFGLISFFINKNFNYEKRNKYHAIIILPSNKGERSILKQIDLSEYGNSFLFIQSIPFVNFLGNNKSEQFYLSFCFLKAAIRCLLEFKYSSQLLSKWTWSQFSKKFNCDISFQNSFL